MTLLRNRSLVALLTAETVSSLGSSMTFLALPWFVLVTTGSAAKMGIVLAVELLPTALFGIPSGALVARLGARQTMPLSDAARVPLMAGIPLLQSAGLLTTPGALRAKVMTAVLTSALVAGPLGLLAVGPLLQALGPYPVFLLVAAGQTLASLFFAGVVIRRRGTLEPQLADVG